MASIGLLVGSINQSSTRKGNRIKHERNQYEFVKKTISYFLIRKINFYRKYNGSYQHDFIQI